MAGFRVLLDDLGIETATAWCVECQVVVNPEKKKAQRYKAVSVVALSADSTASGAIKGAAWGVFIAGGLGAAVGSMIGGGMKVAFELHTEEGEILRGIAGKNAYLDIKKQVEAKAAKAELAKAKQAKQKPAKAKPEDPTGPRAISKRLLVATAILPIPFALGFFRKGYSSRARALAAVWTVLWCIGLSKLPDPPADSSATQEASVASTLPGDEEGGQR